MAVGAYSRKDFVNKLGIAYKEARESKYWLRLLQETCDLKEVGELIEDADEICRILYTIIHTSRKNIRL